MLQENRKNIGYWKAFIRLIRLSWRLFNDNRVSSLTKVIPIAVLMYIISPFDFLPDIFPILGQIDDLALFILGLQIFVNQSPKEVVKYYINAIDSEKNN